MAFSDLLNEGSMGLLWGAKRTCSDQVGEVRVCEAFRMPAHHDGYPVHRGRCPKGSREGNRGKGHV